MILYKWNVEKVKQRKHSKLAPCAMIEDILKFTIFYLYEICKWIFVEFVLVN